MVVTDSQQNDSDNQGVRTAYKLDDTRQVQENDELEDDRYIREVDGQENIGDEISRRIPRTIPDRKGKQSLLIPPEQRRVETMERAELCPRKNTNKTGLNGTVNNEVSDLDSDSTANTGALGGGRSIKFPVPSARNTICESKRLEGSAQ